MCRGFFCAPIFLTTISLKANAEKNRTTSIERKLETCQRGVCVVDLAWKYDCRTSPIIHNTVLESYRTPCVTLDTYRIVFFFFLARCAVLSENANQGLQITINEKMEKLLKVRKRMAKRHNSVKNKRYAFRQHNTVKSYFLLKHIRRKYVGRKD